MQSGTELAREIQLTDWSTPGNLSNRSSGVQIPRDICTRFGRYLYSTKCSWIIKYNILLILPKGFFRINFEYILYIERGAVRSPMWQMLLCPPSVEMGRNACAVRLRRTNLKMQLYFYCRPTVHTNLSRKRSFSKSSSNRRNLNK